MLSFDDHGFNLIYVAETISISFFFIAGYNLFSQSSEICTHMFQLECTFQLRKFHLVYCYVFCFSSHFEMLLLHFF